MFLGLPLEQEKRGPAGGAAGERKEGEVPKSKESRATRERVAVEHANGLIDPSQMTRRVILLHLIREP